MKKLNFIQTCIVMPLLLCLTINSRAQSSLSFTQAMDSLLAPLDKNKITSGILYERVMPLANIDLFNNNFGDPFISEYSYYCQAYFELYNSAYNNTGWLKPEHLKAWAEGEAIKGNYTLGILDYQFNMIDSNAINNGQLTFNNGQFHDVPGATSPYWIRRIQMAAILAEELPSGSVNIRYNPGFVKTNQSIQISSIQLNFGSLGIFFLDSVSSTAQINFTGSGVKEFTITVQYSNGSNFTHSSEVQIGANTEPYSSRTEGTEAELPDVTFWISSKYPYQGTGESQPHYAKAKISIWWKRNSQNLPEPGIKKPVIIVDGFDPVGERKDTGIYKLFRYINQNNNPDNFADELRSFGKDFDIIVMDMPAYTKDFPGTINDPTSSLPYPKSLYDNIAPPDLKGVIFGGGDYQQRNAYNLEALIDYCNQQMLINGSNEKLVVIGPSMGGQISRYALRDMEKRGQNHNCRLWVSFDSNNEGSYAPVGLQYSISAFAANSADASFFRGVYLDCPEAKQSLLHHYLANSATVNGAPGFFDQYYGEVNNPSFGFPQAPGLRKIVMISGSDLGIPQTFGTACQQATRVETKYKPRGFLAFVVSWIVPLGPIPGLIGSIIAAQQVHKTYLAPAVGYCSIFNFNNNLDVFIQAPSWCTTSLDMTQGGHFPAFNIYKKELDGKRPKKWYKNLFKLYADDYIGSGVQQLTYSTLAIGLGSMPDPTRKWNDNFRINSNGQSIDVTCSESKESPFDMYWAPDVNTRHDSLLLGHVVRLRKEIIEKLPWPRTKYERYALVNSDKALICPGETVSFSVTPASSSGVYNWTTSDPFLQIISGQGTSSIVVQHTGTLSNQGSYQINCSGESDCYIYNIHQYNIWAGSYNPAWNYNSPTNPDALLLQSTATNVVWNDVCPYTTTICTTRPMQGRIIAWEYLSGGGPGFSWLQSGDNLHLYFGIENQQASFRVHVTNACGTVTYLYNFRSVLPNCNFGRFVFQDTVSGLKLYPNPSSGVVTVSLNNFVSGEKSKNRIYEILVIDKLGNIRKRYYYGGINSPVHINISELGFDVYSVLVFDGTDWRSAKLVKQ